MKPTTPCRRVRPQLELLESRLQPGSLVSSLGVALADTTLAELNTPPTAEHATPHHRPRPDAADPAGVPTQLVAPNTSPSATGRATTGVVPTAGAAQPVGRSLRRLAEETLALSAAGAQALPGGTKAAAGPVAAHGAGGVIAGAAAPGLRGHAVGPAIRQIPTQGTANAVVAIPDALHTIPMGFTSVRHWHAGDGNSPPPPAALAWATYVTGTGTNATGVSVATDPSQNVYVTGSEGDGDAMLAFVAEYAAGGTPVYYNEFHAEDRDPGFTYGQTESHAIAVDPGGNAYVTGVAVRLETGNTQAFCMKLDAGGNIVQGYGGGLAHTADSNSSGDGIAVDDIGRATLVGSAEFAEGTYAVAVKFDRFGLLPVYAFGYQVTDFGDSAAKAVALDATGDNAYLVGSIYASGASVTSILALKIDNTGPMAGRHVSYAVTAPSDPGPDVLNSVAVDVDGNAYFVGTVTYQGPANAYAAAINADGNTLLFTDLFADTISGTGVSRDNDNNVTYICGSGILPADGRVHGVVAELDAAGVPVDAYVTPGDTMDVSEGVAFNGGIAYMVGMTSSTQLSTDGTTLNGNSDAFLMAVSAFA